MLFKKHFLLVTISALAVIGLIFLQVRWMQQSRSLLENEFEEKVRQAVCSTAEFMFEGNSVCQLICGAPSYEEVDSEEKLALDQFRNDDRLTSALASAMEYYKIPLEYEVQITNEQLECDAAGFPYFFPLDPLINESGYFLQVDFPDRYKYVMGRMRFMLIASLLILSFIVAVFIYINLSVIKQKRLHQQQKDLFDNMAHELSTPLTSISLAMNMLKKNKQFEKDPYIKVVARENAKLRDQVERLLHLSNLEGGEAVWSNDQLDLKSLLDESLESLDLLIIEKGAKIKVEAGNEEMIVNGDAYHLTNAIRNLVENALKYGGPNPEILISLKMEENGVLLSVADKGIGVPRNDQKKIFEKYHRVTSGDTAEGSGFGIGLAYVKKIVEKHDGIIKLVSQNDQGSIFQFTLPLAS